jgi:D-sedoheptulose 7-phosphate isomerase
MTRRPPTRLADHLDYLTAALPELRRDCTRLNRWGTVLAARLTAGHRLLVAGNGGSAAEAQHLTAELVGRFDRDRRPLSAIALHAETSSVTAISNDYGYDQVYARQVRAHARPRDILLLLTTSGTSPNLLSATTAATELGVDTWAMTGPSPLAATRHSAYPVRPPPPRKATSSPSTSSASPSRPPSPVTPS